MATAEPTVKVIRIVRDEQHSPFGFAFRGGYEHRLGFFVTHVVDESPAAAAGLRVGDKIVRVNGFCVDHCIGDEFKMIIQRSNELVLRIIGSTRIPSRKDPSEPIIWCETSSWGHYSLFFGHRATLANIPMSPESSSEYADSSLSDPSSNPGSSASALSPAESSSSSSSVPTTSRSGLDEASPLPPIVVPQQAESPSAEAPSTDSPTATSPEASEQDEGSTRQEASSPVTEEYRSVVVVSPSLPSQVIVGRSSSPEFDVRFVKSAPDPLVQLRCSVQQELQAKLKERCAYRRQTAVETSCDRGCVSYKTYGDNDSSANVLKCEQSSAMPSGRTHAISAKSVAFQQQQAPPAPVWEGCGPSASAYKMQPPVLLNPFSPCRTAKEKFPALTAITSALNEIHANMDHRVLFTEKQIGGRSVQCLTVDKDLLAKMLIWQNQKPLLRLIKENSEYLEELLVLQGRNVIGTGEQELLDEIANCEDKQLRVIVARDKETHRLNVDI